MNLSRWAHRFPRPIIFLIALLAIAGVATIMKLPVLLFPQVSFPRVRVSLSAGDRPAERMMLEVTRPVENLLGSIRGARNVRSITSRGSADIDVDFDWGHNMVTAELQVS